MATTITGEFKKALKVSVVDTLPEQGISNRLYFVLNESSSEDNRYDEYIWVIDQEHPEGTWEKVGYRYIDLTQYYTKEQVDNIANTKISKGTLKTINGEQLEGTGDIKIGVTNLDPVQSLAYGVEWDINNSSPILTRIGNLELHRTLPIQSAFRGCVCQGKKIMYYLDPDDWSKKKDGTNSDLTGYDGTVEVETPEFYLWSEVDGDKRRVWVSFSKLSPYAIRIPRMLIGAYRATILNEVPQNYGYLSTLSVNTAVSINNSSEYCRGGDGNTSFDVYADPLRSTLNKPKTNVSRNIFRKYARQAGKELLFYEYYKAIFYWLYVIEYANFNSQADYNPNLTSEGFRQGGLGLGITNLGTYMLKFNNLNPVTPNSIGTEIGNNTGIITIDPYDYYTTINSMNIVNWPILYSASVVKDSGAQSLTIVQALQNTDIIRGSYTNVYGTYTLNVQGLQEGQSITIIEGDTTFTIDTDGDYNLTFNNALVYKNIRTNFSGSCNIVLTTPVVPDTQEVQITLPQLNIPKWRGFTNPFGDIYTNLDGIIIVNEGSDNKSSVYTTTNPDNFGDTEEYKNKMNLAGYQTNTNGYIKGFDLGETAEMIPSDAGGASSVYMCDFNSGSTSDQYRTLILSGGSSTHSLQVGLAYFNSTNSINDASNTIGFRLVEIIN